MNKCLTKIIMQYFRRLLLLLFLFVTGIIYAEGQENADTEIFTKDDIIKFTEKKYGLDDFLINGEKYLPLNIKVNGSPYFEWDKSIEAKLYITGQLYSNIKIEYDINLNELVLNNGQGVHVILNSSLVDSFYLGYNCFIKLNEQKGSTEQYGYFEKVFVGKSLLLKQHKKSIITIYNDLNPNGSFSSNKYEYFIYNQATLINVSSKKLFLRFYEPYRKDIKKFISRNGIKYKGVSNEELYKLMIFCEAKSK